MPKLSIDYSNSIIYKLCCRDVNVKEIYVGSTTNFRARKNQHKSCCKIIKKKNNIKVYQ